MTLRTESDLIPVISRLSRQAKSLGEAIVLFQPALASEIGDATLLVDLNEQGMSPATAKSVAEFMDARQFPFRGVYTASLTAGSRKVGRLFACFGAFGLPDKSLPAITSHLAGELSSILARTRRTIAPPVVAEFALALAANREAA